MNVFWTTGFEPLRRRYDGRFLYFIYLWWTPSYLIRSDGWGEPYRQLYKPGGAGEQSGGSSGGGGGTPTPTVTHIATYSSYTATSAWQAGQLSIPSSGEVLIVVFTERDTSFIGVSQISHPGLGNFARLQVDDFQINANVRVRVELWRGTASPSSGQLAITFTGTSYFHAAHVYLCDNLPGYKGRAVNTGVAVPSIQATPSAGGATVGIAAATAQVSDSAYQIAISPWSDQQSAASPGSVRRTRVHTRVNSDVSGATQTLAATQGSVSGMLCAYLF